MTKKKQWNHDTRAKIIARAWKDEHFRKQLVDNPNATLKSFGCDIPENMNLKVLCDDPTHIHFVLPNPPANFAKISESELGRLYAAGSTPNSLDCPSRQFTCHAVMPICPS